MVVENVVQSKLVFHADMIIGWKMFVCICVYLALPQLGSVPWIPDTSSQRGVGWARFGAGSLAQSGWSAARKPDTTEGRAQGTEHIDQLQTLLLCQCWRKFWYDPLPFWYRGKSTLACVSLNQSQLSWTVLRSGCSDSPLIEHIKPTLPCTNTLPSYFIASL